MKFIKTDVVDVFTSLALFHSFFVYLAGLERLFQCISIIFLLPYVISHYQVLFYKRFRAINITAALYSCWIIISSFKSRSLQFYDKPASFYAISIVSIGFIFAFIVIESFVCRRRVHICLKTFYFCTIAYLLVSIVNLLFIDEIDSGAGFIVGTKFQVSYLSVFLVALYYSVFRKKDNNFLAILSVHIVVALAISIYVQCSTSIIGLALFVLVLASPDAGVICRRPAIVLGALIFFDTCLIFFQAVLDIPAISFVVQQVLHEDMTLSSRTLIYENLPFVLEEMPITGYGLGNSFAVCHPLIGAPNSQNGLIDCLIQVGVPGLLLSVTLCAILLSKSCPIRRNRGLLSMIWFYILVSSVEITFDLQFILLCLFLLNNDTKNNSQTDKDLQRVQFAEIH